MLAVAHFYEQEAPTNELCARILNGNKHGTLKFIARDREREREKEREK